MRNKEIRANSRRIKSKSLMVDKNSLRKWSDLSAPLRHANEEVVNLRLALKKTGLQHKNESALIICAVNLRKIQRMCKMENNSITTLRQICDFSAGIIPLLYKTTVSIESSCLEDFKKRGIPVLHQEDKTFTVNAGDLVFAFCCALNHHINEDTLLEIEKKIQQMDPELKHFILKNMDIILHDPKLTPKQRNQSLLHAAREALNAYSHHQRDYVKNMAHSSRDEMERVNLFQFIITNLSPSTALLEAKRQQGS